MSLQISGSYFFVQPGEKCFRVASNYTNYLELGVRGGTSYYLEARIEDDSFQVNAVIYDPHGGKCTVENNFPDEHCTKRVTPTGYEILGSGDQVLLGLDAEDNICHIRGTLYDADGSVIAEDEGDDYFIRQGPAVLGKSGGTRGVVIG